MTKHDSILQKQVIRRSVYSLLAVVVVVFLIILVLLQIQYTKNSRRDALVNNYHLVISEKGLNLLNVIDKTKLWFGKKFIDKHSSDSHSKSPAIPDRASPTIIRVELTDTDQLDALEDEVARFSHDVKKLEQRYVDPDFKIINSLLYETQENVQQTLGQLEVNNADITDKLEELLEPLSAVIQQLQRSHQNAYEELRLSVDEYRFGNQLQFISLIGVLLIIGLIAVSRLLGHVHFTLKDLEKTQDILYVSEQNYSALTNNMHGGVLVNFKGKTVYANNSLAKMLGYETANDLFGTTIEELVYPDKVEDVSTRCHLQMHGKEFDSHFETTLQTATGKPLFVDLNATTTIWQGESACLITIRDISEQKESEQALQKIKYTLDQTLDCVFMFDAKSLIFTYTNEGAIQQIGYSREELLHMHPYDIKPDISEEKFRDMIAPLLREEQVSLNFETTHQHKNGMSIPVEISLQYITSFDSDPHFIAIVRDITERKAIELALHESFELNDRIINESPIGMAIYDSSGQCLTANTSIAKMAGVAYEQLLLQNINAIQTWATQEVLALVQVAKSSNCKEQIEVGVSTSSGKKVYFDFRIIPFEMKKFQHVLILVDDITERKLSDEEIEKYRSNLVQLVEDRTADVVVARDEAERANMAKSEFLSHMSHELRTPLNAIIGFGQLLSLDKDMLSESQQDSVNEITAAGHHLLYLINEILDLAKIESGKVDLIIEDVVIDTLLQECFALIGNHTEQRHIELIDNISDADFSVQADRNRLKQVILNLLSNAVKYNRESGRIILNSKVIDDKRLRISITDTGEGLNDDELAKLFTSFVRLDTLNNVEGTGIGLVITKQLVEYMNGVIGVESTKGEGSTFWFELPLGASHHPDSIMPVLKQTDHIQTVKESKTKHTVLYIEDNIANLRLISKLLERRPDIKMWSATEPMSGLELAREHKPDMILLDINLPGMDGYEVLKHLQQQYETCNTPVIAISANAMRKDIEKGFEAGFADYLTKPVNVETFYSAIDATLINGPC